MGLFRRKQPSLSALSSPTAAAEQPAPPSEAQVAEIQLDAMELVDGHRDFVEIEVVGESHYQDALERLAGPRNEFSKFELVGVTLRCDPDNPHDRYAIRVECQGQLVGYVKRGFCGIFHPAIARRFGGALECAGVIVGGWDRGMRDRGMFGIRVWVHHTIHERLIVP
jgi:hypothetical protein